MKHTQFFKIYFLSSLQNLCLQNIMVDIHVVILKRMNTSVKIKLRNASVLHKQRTICLQLIHDRKIKVLSTRFRVYPHEWDAAKESIRFDKADIDRHDYLESVKRNLEAELKQIAELVTLLAEKGNYTVDELAGLYSNSSFNGYLFPFIDFLVKKLRADNRTKTASIYTTVKKSFSNFRFGQDIIMDRIDNDLLLQYEAWLKNAGMIKNSISCYMRALRSIYNQAVKRGLSVQKNPFGGTYTGIDKTIKRAVSETIIIQLKNMDLSDNPTLELTRDMFMFSFYLRGISFVDMANLKTNDLNNGYLTYIRSKTGQGLTIKMEDCMNEIVTRYSKQTIHNYLLPIYTEQNHDHSSHLRTYNKRLEHISGLLGLEKPLSSYVSRHSWATMALRKGISIEIISESMGHENETTTRIYLASLGQSVVDEANEEIIKL